MKRVFLMALLAVSGQTALAQGKPALRVVVEGITAEAQQCGIKKPAIESAAAQALKQHGIQVSTEGSDPHLYLNVNAYRVMQEATVVGCTTRIGVSVRGGADAQPALRGFKSKTGAYVVLCEVGRLLSGAQRDVAAAITKAFQEDIKRCLADLSY
jgi:hypothetical protein